MLLCSRPCAQVALGSPGEVARAVDRARQDIFETLRGMGFKVTRLRQAMAEMPTATVEELVQRADPEAFEEVGNGDDAEPLKNGLGVLAPDLRPCDRQDFTVCCKAHLSIAGMRRLARNQVLI